MIRIVPDQEYSGYPCSVVAVSCAIKRLPEDLDEYLPQLRSDGYAKLNVSNRFIRNHLKIKKRIDYKRGERPKLKDLHLAGKALVCVYGHMIYIEDDVYWSFFDNEEDDVVAVWLLD